MLILFVHNLCTEPHFSLNFLLISSFKTTCQIMQEALTAMVDCELLVSGLNDYKTIYHPKEQQSHFLSWLFDYYWTFFGLKIELVLFEPNMLLPCPSSSSSSFPATSVASSTLNSAAPRDQGKIIRHQSFMQMRGASSLELLCLLNIRRHN